MKSVTCSGPVNIAVIKYWGKKDEKLITPLNDSISVTLSQDELRAKTTVTLSETYAEDKIWLNGIEEPISNPRLQACLREIRARAQTQHGSIPAGCVQIVSENNFPTAAGLASSAAGYACLVFALSRLYDVSGDISAVARQGSGSACRSVLGGFVRWRAGERPDGTDSLAEQVAPASHWPDLHCLILIACHDRKKVASTSGMSRTAETSELMRARLEGLPARLTAITTAIEQRDFPAFAELTMRDSNQLHAVCQDTYPPIRYMTDVSHAVVETVHTYNRLLGGMRACYTFDAGPNACIYLPAAEVGPFLAAVARVFPPPDPACWVTGRSVELPQLPEELAAELQPRIPGGVQGVIHTAVGDGPRLLEQTE
ncbi:diphosphomevalonate decarboxylase-like [Amphibalanus amphitrite]|uniref:diphosphomevalonate decarboxylase-like n=1 Tax=Amphibalanus amphitrite TaxID=1232801 RepID=UPI001C921BF5|nr:diphosphomevalonate decarboxylase-like [Amphibalanus amphitrite]